MAAMSSSPIVRLLNEQVHHYHRWCTPSVLPAQERVEDFYASDVSISAAGVIRTTLLIVCIATLALLAARRAWNWLHRSEVRP